MILKAYDCWKEKSCKKLNGIFAFAVWDDEARKLFLCRDRIGVKPLFYAQKQGIFAFASRIKSLLLIPEISADVDENGLNEIFMLGPAKPIGSAVFKDIKELPPACFMTVSGEKPKFINIGKLRRRSTRKAKPKRLSTRIILFRTQSEGSLFPMCRFALFERRA